MSAIKRALILLVPVFVLLPATLLFSLNSVDSVSPNANNVFSGWGGDISGSTNPYLLTMNGNKSVTANFTSQPSTCYTLSRSHTGIGEDPTANPTNSAGCGTGQYKAGQSISLTAAPSAGWRVKNWSGTNANNSTATTNSVSMPAANHSVGVVYEVIPVTGNNVFTPVILGTGEGHGPNCFIGPLEDEPNNSRDEANGPLCYFDTYFGLPNDTNDYFSFNTYYGGQISIELTDHVGGGVQLLLYQDGFTQPVAIDQTPADGWRLNYQGTPDRYDIRIFSITPKPESSLQYTLQLSFNSCFIEPLEIEPNNSRNEANGPLCSPGSYRGLPNDSNDYFSFDSAAGQISIELTGHVGEGLQLSLLREGVSNPVVRDYDPAGGWRLDYQGTAGRYYVRIFAATPKPGSAQEYTLQVTYPAGN